MFRLLALVALLPIISAFSPTAAPAVSASRSASTINSALPPAAAGASPGVCPWGVGHRGSEVVVHRDDGRRFLDRAASCMRAGATRVAL
eukprot:7187904-Prymnesium_polylepis.2